MADADLDKLEAYIAKENSPGVAIDVVIKIVDAAHLILPEPPGAGRPGRLKGSRELVIDGLPFIVIYRQDYAPDQLQILRMLHGAQ